MRRMMSVIDGLAMACALAVPLAVMPVMAQTGKLDPPIEEERMRGMGERVDDMAKRMERMTHMMERHQRRLESGCPALAPKDPKSGG